MDTAISQLRQTFMHTLSTVQKLSPPMQCSPVWDLETGNKKEKPAKPTSQVGGGLGIRTLGALQHTTFRESHLRPLGQPSRLYVHPIRFGKWGELLGRTQRIFLFRTLKTPHKSRLFWVERSAKRFRFRVSPVMTTSIPLHLN